MNIDRIRQLAGLNENDQVNAQIVSKVTAMIEQYPYLSNDISNVRVVNGNIMYTYDGFMDCAILHMGGLFGDLGDTSEEEVKNGTYRDSDVRWFPTLDKLLQTINSEADPDR